MPPFDEVLWVSKLLSVYMSKCKRNVEVYLLKIDLIKENVGIEALMSRLSEIKCWRWEL